MRAAVDPVVIVVRSGSSFPADFSKPVPLAVVSLALSTMSGDLIVPTIS